MGLNSQSCRQCCRVHKTGRRPGQLVSSRAHVPRPPAFLGVPDPSTERGGLCPCPQQTSEGTLHVNRAHILRGNRWCFLSGHTSLALVSRAEPRTWLFLEPLWRGTSGVTLKAAENRPYRGEKLYPQYSTCGVGKSGSRIGLPSERASLTAHTFGGTGAGR